MKQLLIVLALFATTVVRAQTSGTLDQTFNAAAAFNNVVRNIIPLEDGTILMAGEFTIHNSLFISRIIKLNDIGTRVATFSADVNGPIMNMAVQSDGKIIIVGEFTSVSGVARNNIARLNSDGTLDITFDVGTGFDARAEAVEIQSDGKILVGGVFQIYRGVTAKRIIRLTSLGAIDATFETGVGFDGTVLDIEVLNDNRIVLVGTFSTYKLVSASRIVCLNADGSRNTTFNVGAGLNNYGSTIVKYGDNSVLIGGEFTSYKTTNVNRLIKLDLSGEMVTNFNIGSGFNSIVQEVVVHPTGKIYAVGNFGTVNGTNRKHVVRLNANGSIDNTITFLHEPNGAVVSCAIQPNGRILLGGIFENHSGYTTNRVARLYGCDAIAPATPVVTYDAATGLSTNTNAHSYQWFTCAGSPVASQNSATFNNPPVGDYYLQILDECGYGKSTCINVSNCAVTKTDTVKTCDNYHTWIDGVTYSVPNTTATFLIPNVAANGCDSLITLNLVSSRTVSPVPTTANLPSLSSLCELTQLTAPTAVDGCGTTIVGTHNLTLPLTTPGLTVITWTYDNGIGGVSTQIQNVTILSTTAPIANVGNLPTITESCSVTSLIPPTATSACGEQLQGVTTTTFPITTIGTNAVIWRYTDAYGNFTTQVQDVIITENTEFTPTIATLPALNATCSITVLEAPTATYGCGEIITATHTSSLPLTAQGSQTIYWTYTAANNSTYTQVQHVIIYDPLGPVPSVSTLPSITSHCAVSNVLAPMAEDNCSGMVEGTTTTLFPIETIGQTTIVWTFEDENGNVTTQEQVVIINPLTNAVELEEGIMYAMQADAYYQWIDCDNNNEPILGEVDYAFEPTSNGNYAVIITKGDCSVTSDCITISTVGITALPVNSFKISPNPTTGKVFLSFDHQEAQIELEIVDNAGRVVMQSSYSFEKDIQIQLDGQPGFYYLKIRTTEGESIQKVSLH